MITEHDIEIVEAIKKDIDLRAMKKNEMDWNAIHQIEVLDIIVNNLRIAHVSYRAASTEDIADNYYTAECSKCDWWGSSKLLHGGGAIADTGDHFDYTCPVCGSPEVDERNCRNINDTQYNWISVKDRLPEPLQTVWLTNSKGWTALGCLVETNDGWHWAESNGVIYQEGNKIVSECDSGDLDVVLWHELPDVIDFKH